jgi:CheY-like chemotaxis protein
VSVIHLVDDNQSYRAAIREFLEPLGHRVVESRNGQAVIETCEQVQPDLVITDVLLPEQGGLQVLRELRERFPRVQIIALSGSWLVQSPEFLALIKELGIQAVVRKPFRSTALMNRIEEALQTKRLQAQTNAKKANAEHLFPADRQSSDFLWLGLPVNH